MGENKSIGRLISILYRQSKVYFHKKLEPYELDHGQMPVLMYVIHHNGSTQHDISNYFHLDKGSTSSLIKSLEKNGFVKKEQHGEDRRSYMIYTTQKTERLLPEFHQIFQGWTEILLEGFTDDEKEQSFTLLNRMIENTHHNLKGEGQK